MKAVPGQKSEENLPELDDHERAHFYRSIIEYLVSAGSLDDAAAYLSNFGYHHDRLRALGEAGARSTDALFERLESAGGGRAETPAWRSFFRERAHLLQRGSNAWPSNKILLQLAAEHADDSPVTRAAESWSATGCCDWLWLRRVDRPSHVEVAPCLHVLEVHGAFVTGATQLRDGRVLSWSSDGTLRVWDATGKLVRMIDPAREIQPSLDLDKHVSNRVEGACLLAGGDRVLFWRREETLLWIVSLSSASPICVLYGHTDYVLGAIALTDGRIVSWARDSTLRAWDASGSYLSVAKVPLQRVAGAVELEDGRVLWWGDPQTVGIWDLKGERRILSFSAPYLAALANRGGPIILGFWDAWSERNVPAWHTGPPVGARQLRDGRIVSWGEDRSVRVWHTSGEHALSLEGHTSDVSGTLELSGRRLISWGGDATPRIWRLEDGRELAKLVGHSDRVRGVVELLDGRLASWSFDASVRLWTAGGAPISSLDGHLGRIEGMTELAGGGLLTWGSDGTIRVWDDVGTEIGVIEAHDGGVGGVIEFEDSTILSWGTSDTVLRVWDLGRAVEARKPRSRHGAMVRGALPLSDGRVLSWGNAGELRIWSAPHWDCRYFGDRSEGAIEGAVELSSGNIVSWSKTSLRVQTSRGNLHCCLDGHTGWVRGVRELSDGRILSWDNNKALCIWTPAGELVTVLHYDAADLDSATQLDNGTILARGMGEYRAWSASGQPIALLAACVVELPSGILISWEGRRCVLWDGRCATPLGMDSFERYSEGTWKVADLPDGDVLTFDLHALQIRDAKLGNVDVSFVKPPTNPYAFASRVGGRLLDRQTLVDELGRRVEVPEDFFAVFRAHPYAPLSHGAVATTADRGQLCVALIGKTQDGAAHSESVYWHGDGAWAPASPHFSNNAEFSSAALSHAGVVPIRCERDLAILQLFRGARRVDVADAVQFFLGAAAAQ